jgi:predicted DNA-binding transcriptional regulator AlpA
MSGQKGGNMDAKVPQRKPGRLLRLPEVLEIVPVGKTTWWEGCSTGKFPSPVKLGPRITAWFEADIIGFIESLKSGRY